MRLPTPTIALAGSLLSALAAPTHAAAAERDADARAFETKPGAFALLLTAAAGDGLRFNNPYRLATVLGSDAQSLSRSAAYVDLGAAMLVGTPYGLRHGVALRWSLAVEGISQAVAAPTYELWKRWRFFAAYGRAGPTFVLTPSSSWGFEGAAGGVWFVRSGLGLTAEIVGDVFYGAGTRDVATATYPMLSAELGAVVDFEVLP
jgi:hypothetical protein